MAATLHHSSAPTDQRCHPLRADTSRPLPRSAHMEHAAFPCHCPQQPVTLKDHLRQLFAYNIPKDSFSL